MSAVFWSRDVERRVLDCYRGILDSWSTPHREHRLSTSQGETFVLSAGDPANPPVVLLPGPWRLLPCGFAPWTCFVPTTMCWPSTSLATQGLAHHLDPGLRPTLTRGGWTKFSMAFHQVRGICGRLIRGFARRRLRHQKACSCRAPCTAGAGRHRSHPRWRDASYGSPLAPGALGSSQGAGRRHGFHPNDVRGEKRLCQAVQPRAIRVVFREMRCFPGSLILRLQTLLHADTGGVGGRMHCSTRRLHGSAWLHVRRMQRSSAPCRRRSWPPRHDAGDQEVLSSRVAR